jgi:hypothetical protein
MTRLHSGVFGLVSLLLPTLAVASLIQALDLTELTAQSDRIVVAQVTSARSEWDRSHRTIHTVLELKIEEVWKGSAAERVTLIQPGGTAGDVEMRVHGMPSFLVGEKSLLFLAGQAAPRVVGMSQGKRSLRWDDASKRWMAEMAEHSAVVRRDSRGHLQPAQPEPAMALDELRQRVRALVMPPAGKP